MHASRPHVPTPGRSRGCPWWGRPVLQWLALGAALGFALASPPPVHAKTFHCHSRDVSCQTAAITEANTNGQQENAIALAAGTYTPTAAENPTDGPNGLRSVTSTLTITGPDAETTS